MPGTNVTRLNLETFPTTGGVVLSVEVSRSYEDAVEPSVDDVPEDFREALISWLEGDDVVVMSKDDRAALGLMNDVFFRALLDLFMASDPTPDPGGNVVRGLDHEAQRRGYDSWVDAYHQFGKGKNS